MAPRRSLIRTTHLQPMTGQIETLEDRTLLSVVARFVADDRETLLIESNSSDDIIVTVVGNEVLVNNETPETGPLTPDRVVKIEVIGGQGANLIDLSGVQSVDFTRLTSINVHGNDGSDTIIASDIGGIYVGGHGSDVLIGGTGDDVLDGDDGDDTIVGGFGDDTLIGEDGNDVIDGGAGDDVIDGGDGADSLVGGIGNDSLIGGDHPDTLDGDVGDDTLTGNMGEDVLNGGDGQDKLFGGASADVLNGDAGDDTLLGQGGRDTLNGGDGNDIANGGDGRDSLLGNMGNDTLSGNDGNDTLVAGDGNNHLLGGRDDDILVGGMDDETLMGQSGADTLFGGGGADLLIGGVGDDLIHSGAPGLSISDVEVIPEGDTGTSVARFTVSLLRSNRDTVTVDFETFENTATADVDFESTTGTITFAPNETVQTIEVTIIGDLITEGDETFVVDLSNAVNSMVLDGRGVGTIIDDDMLTVSIDDVTVMEAALAGPGPAIRIGFDGNTLAPNDDLSTGMVPIGFNINYFGLNFTDLFVNNNGNVTFTGPLGTFTPFDLLSTSTPIIAPFFADVDTGGPGLPVTYGAGIVDGRTAFGVNWIDVGHFFQGLPLNSFQLILIDRSDIRPGDFDIEFNYDQILWEAGEASGSDTMGLGGFSARVGFSNGINTSFELPGSAVNGAFLDSGPAATSLINNSLNSDTLGRYVFRARDGIVDTSSTTAVFTVTLSGTSSTTTSVSYSLIDGTATGGPPPFAAGVDYDNTSGTVMIAAGMTTATISVPIAEDSLFEPTENFFVSLTNVVGAATILDGLGEGTIIDSNQSLSSTTTTTSTGSSSLSSGATSTAPFKANIAPPASLSVDASLIQPAITFGLTTGVGDASVSVGVDGFGAFGSSVGFDSTDATYDPVGPIGPAGTVFESGVAIRTGQFGPRQFLTSGDIGVFGSTGGLTNPVVTGDSTTALSAFSVGMLSFDLDQTVGPLIDMTGAQNGSKLTQTYDITNTGGSTIDFELVRYIDGDLLFDGTLIDGGGRLVLSDGTEILFETDAGGTADTDTTFLGITATGGTIPTANRFEIDVYFDLVDDVNAGVLPDDMILADFDGDEFVDAGSEYDVTLALRNLFSLAPGETVTYVTETFWGSGAPSNLGPPPPPPEFVDTVGDTLVGSRGNDTLFGSDGTDLLRGNAGHDLMDGGNADDTLFGGAGRDTIFGNDGNDLIEGGNSGDILNGGRGDDTFVWMSGDDSDFNNGGLGLDEVRMTTTTANDRFRVGGQGTFLAITHSTPTSIENKSISQSIEEVFIVTDGGKDSVIVDDLTGVASIQRLSFDLGRNSDFFDASAQNNARVRIDVFGGIANDTIVGGAGADFIDGGAGHDSLSGGAGDDTIDGGNGVDKLFGNQGADSLVGGRGRDSLVGNSGDDTLDGGDQNDRLFGGIGNDLILAGDGADVVRGGSGDDSIEGGLGDDSLLGDRGADTIHGDDGNDTLDGGDDDDTLFGDRGDDTLDGGFGNDVLFGGTGFRIIEDGNDSLLGSRGNDTIFGEKGDDTIRGGAGHDELRGGAGSDQLVGNGGHDSILGGDGDDTLLGGDGNDTLNGGHGADKLFGEAGDDGLVGHDGDDTLHGGAGHDTLLGGDGNDNLRGGALSDLLIGGDGDDNLNGQGGSFDTLVGGDSFDILDDNGGSDIIDNSFFFFADWIDDI